MTIKAVSIRGYNNYWLSADYVCWALACIFGFVQNRHPHAYYLFNKSWINQYKYFLAITVTGREGFEMNLVNFGKSFREELGCKVVPDHDWPHRCKYCVYRYCANAVQILRKYWKLWLIMIGHTGGAGSEWGFSDESHAFQTNKPWSHWHPETKTGNYLKQKNFRDRMFEGPNQ